MKRMRMKMTPSLIDELFKKTQAKQPPVWFIKNTAVYRVQVVLHHG
jgi:hypothetical protein